MAIHNDHPELPDGLEILLTEGVSTVFIKADCPVRVKQGHISAITLDEIEGEQWDTLALQSLGEALESIVENNTHRSDCFLEIDRKGCKVLQVGDLRITCAWPPFSDAWEVTIVRPVAKLSLDEYELPEALLKRLADHHRGVFISGRPGSGKTTLAQAIAEHLDEEIGAMVKTMEAPRDLQLRPRITQYAPLEGDLEKTAEIIFLVRPDFVIFDEVRRTRDFEIFADVRLAGVGLLGVTHANSALEAIQRLIGKVELGLVPQVLDTVLHVEKGKISEVLELRMTVKAPSGMQEELSRPVVEIVRFPEGRVCYEMFAFGSEIAVVPVGDKKSSSPLLEMARGELTKDLRNYLGIANLEVEIVSERNATIYVPDSMIGAVVGQGGSTIREIEDSFNLKFQVKGIKSMPRRLERIPEEAAASGWDLQNQRSMGGRQWENQQHSQKSSRRNKRKGR